MLFYISAICAVGRIDVRSFRPDRSASLCASVFVCVCANAMANRVHRGIAAPAEPGRAREKKTSTNCDAMRLALLAFDFGECISNKRERARSEQRRVQCATHKLYAKIQNKTSFPFDSNIFFIRFSFGFCFIYSLWPEHAEESMQYVCLAAILHFALAMWWCHIGAQHYREVEQHNTHTQQSVVDA